MAEPAHALVLVALGGNTLLRPGQPASYEAQAETLRNSQAVVVELIRRGCRVIITHGNGPQVGHILLRVEAARGQAYELPLDACVAQSQGEMGYLIQQCLENLLQREGLERPVATLLTRTVVEKRDPRMQHPTKPVGPRYTRGHAAAMEQRGYHVAPEPSGGFRRVVPSPWPLRIVEEEAIRRLIEREIIVIAAGGGGIPVHVEGDGTLTGVEAVVDKDLASAVLAVELGVERIVNLTAVEHAKLRFNTPEEQDLTRLTIAEAERYLKEGHFAPGSMGPKVESAIWFLERGGRDFIITTPERAIDALEGKTGTHIFLDGR